MSVAPHLFVDDTSNRSKTAIKAETSPSKKLAQKRNLEKISSFDDDKVNNMVILNQQMPIWLRSLLVLESGSKFFTLLMLAVSLFLYGLTVNFPQRWNEAYNKLITLERIERELIEKNEALKNQLATEAKQDSAMMTLDPTKTLFLETTSTKIVVQTSSTSTTHSQPFNSLGY